jgi:signal transduction histidine kinase
MTRAFGSLQNRIFIASALLTAVSIGVAVYVVRVRLTTETETELAKDLVAAASVVGQQQATLFDTFSRSAGLLADLPRFKAAVDTGDAPTVQPLAEDFQRRLGSDVLTVTSRRGARLASVGAPAAGVLRVVDLPITLDQDELGTLSAGYLLDEARAHELKALTGADIAFAVGGRVQASTLGPGSFALLSGVVAGAPPVSLQFDGAEYVALAQPLPAPVSGPASLHGQPSVVVLHSRTERMRTLNAIQTFLAGLALLSVVLAVAISYWVARTVTRPLATITNHMRGVAATGDLGRKIDLAAWNDDDAAVLATTYNSLTDSVQRFQREAAQRERLSSLGRMSTVIAHEVRNPLMIIKGALRTLGRDGASPEDVRDAAADIDGEINRLNHLVNEVLDFARPIRFDCSPTDINDVCREAAAAAQAAGAVAVGVHTPPGTAMIDTDRERLRGVLVNLLTNAQHAVEAAGRVPAAGAAPAVTVTTTPAGPRRVTVIVSDHGTGIAPEDLPRVFDPYFTTRRAGTGLGLAIARNIVDGLGGTLTVSTRQGQGTDIRLDIGDAPRAARGR